MLVGLILQRDLRTIGLKMVGLMSGRYWHPAMVALFGGIIALVLSYVGVGRLRRWVERRNVIDIPNERSSHTSPTPRGGGLVIVAVSLLGMIGLFLTTRGCLDAFTLAYLGGGCLVAVVGWVDDLRGLPALARLAAHLGAAVLFLRILGGLPDDIAILGWTAPLGILIWPLALVWLAGVTNIYNFMDGIDGIASGQAIVAGFFWMWAGWYLANDRLLVAAILLTSTSAGFLLHNLPPARIFLGDVGSGFLGFCFAALPLAATKSVMDTRWWIAGALVLFPFLFDSTFTLAGRASRGENLLHAHRSHIYQRLVLAGWGHGRVSILFTALAAAGGVFAIIYLTTHQIVVQVAMLVIPAILMTALSLLTGRLEGLRRCED